jgi:hypothetical protein
VEGLELGRAPGDWYGINAISHIVQGLNEKYSPIAGFKVCVFNDGNIICDQIDQLGCSSNEVEAKMVGTNETDSLS